MTPDEAKSLVGARVLVKDATGRRTYSMIWEARILEITPAGYLRVRLRGWYGLWEEWRPAADWTLVEKLREEEPPLPGVEVMRRRFWPWGGDEHGN
jgi:hypothetical protein